MCGEAVEKTCLVDESTIVCESCYNLKKSFDLLYKEQKAKIFVDVFNKDDAIYYNIFVFDFVNEDFQIITRRSDFDNIYTAKYQVILFVCDYVEDMKNIIIYTDFKTLEKHVEGEYRSRSQSMKNEFYRLQECIDQGLEVRFIEKPYNLARMCPMVFKFFHRFDDYKRKTDFQYKKGEKEEEKNGNGNSDSSKPKTTQAEDEE